MSLDVLVEINMNVTTFWDVTLCNVAHVYQRFAEASCLLLQVTLNIQAMGPFDIMASIYYWY